MMSKHTIKYSHIVDTLDIDAFEEAINFEPIEQKGSEDRGKCIDIWGMHKHGDTTGKFSINRDKKLYYCFLCGGGTLLSLAMEFTGLEEEDATEWLCQFARGDTRSDNSFMEDFMKLFDRYEQKKAERMPYFNEYVLERFDFDYIDWYDERGISQAVIEKHKVGHSDSTMKMAPKTEDENYFGPCIIFPHYWEGRLVGWQSRWMHWDKKHTYTPVWLPKYTNTSEFPKHNTLYNYDATVKSSNSVFVVESIPTCLYLETNGFSTVSPFGGGIKEPQLRLLRRFHDGVYLCPDNDEVGDKFVTTAADYLERYVEVKIIPKVKSKPGADLGDLVGTGDLNEYVKRAYNR
jgi:DNA primase